MTKLASTEGIRWAFLKPTWVPHDAPPGHRQLLRLRVIETPLFAVWVHRHLRPDPGRHLHDHPASFVTWIIKGGYRESRKAAKPLHHKRWSFRYMKAEWPHSILELDEVPTITILLVGRRRRPWGFDTPTGWMHHVDYLKGNRGY
jgi:hypothetical protein